MIIIVAIIGSILVVKGYAIGYVLLILVALDAGFKTGVAYTKYMTKKAMGEIMDNICKINTDENTDDKTIQENKFDERV